MKTNLSKKAAQGILAGALVLGGAALASTPAKRGAFAGDAAYKGSTIEQNIDRNICNGKHGCEGLTLENLG